MSKRVFITGFWHETNTFASSHTSLEDFRAYQFVQGDRLLAAFADTNTEIGGVLNAALELDIPPVPGLFAGAVPSVLNGVADALSDLGVNINSKPLRPSLLSKLMREVCERAD